MSLSQLPDEILIIIFENVSSYDLINLSRTCRKFDSLSYEKKLTRALNFHHEFNLRLKVLKPFLSRNQIAINVKTIDLTSCYWLNSSTISKILSLLKYVENVLVADTPFSPHHLKHLLTTKPIKRLSWTFHKDIVLGQGFLKEISKTSALEYLFLVVEDESPMNLHVHVPKFIMIWHDCLKYLWVVNESAYPSVLRDFMPNLRNMPSLRSLVVSSESWSRCFGSAAMIGNPDSQIKNCNNLVSLSLSSRDTANLCNLSTKEVPNLKHLSIVLDHDFPNYDVLKELTDRLPKLKSLHLPLPALHCSDFLDSQPFIEELALLPNTCACKELCAKNICLTVARCKKIKRLSLPALSLFSNSPPRREKYDTRKTTKQRLSRVASSPINEETPFHVLVENTPLVEEFEIGLREGEDFLFSMQWKSQRNFAALSALANWKELTVLTLANLNIVHGKFLHDITKNCRLLKSLRLINLGPVPVCSYSSDLLEALPHCSALVDFQWKQSNLGEIRKLWVVLRDLKMLQRVSIQSDGNSDLDERSLVNAVLELKFLYFVHVFTNSTRIKSKRIQNQIIHRCKEHRPALYVCIDSPPRFFQCRIPTVHYKEIVDESSHIAWTSASHRFLIPKYHEPYEWAPHL